MGKEFRGTGRSESRVELDPKRGVMLAVQGETRICTSVMDHTSTNRTTFAQKLLGSTYTKPPPEKRPEPPRYRLPPLRKRPSPRPGKAKPFGAPMRRR